MLKRLLTAGALALACSAALAGSTSFVAVSNGSYTDLGAGPYKVENRSTQSIRLCEADSQPSSFAGCHVLLGGSPAYDFATTSHLWAQAIQPGSTAYVAVSPLQATTYDQSYSVITPTYAQVSATTTAQTLAQMGATVPAGATLAFFAPSSTGSGVTVRYRCDGTAPTASVGMPIQAGQAWPIQGAGALAACQFISATGSAVTADLEFRG